MPEFVHTFQAGKMNKDLDERLVPNGEYRDALNLDIANSEGSNIGSLQNVKGNLQILYGLADDYLANWVNPVCIGSVADTQNDKLYWLVTSDNNHGIIEYDKTTNQISPVLIDTLNNTLKFNKDYLITGINILDKFLIFTDNNEEPKKINIEKFKTGSVDFDTHTLLPNYIASTEEYLYIPTNPAVSEEYVTIIKKGPLSAPTLNMSSSEYPGDEPGTGLTPVVTEVDGTDGYENFTYVPDVAGAPSVRIPLPTYGEYLQYLEDENNPSPTYPGSSIEGWNGEVQFVVSNSVPSWTVGSKVLLSGNAVDSYNNTFDYNVRVSIVNVFGTTITAHIESISSNILLFSEPIIWEAIIEEKAPMFEYVFPRFAYRWKYEDNEYSTFSPFSEVAFLGDDFEYIAADGYNIGMTNNIRKLFIESLQWGNDEVVELDILYKESNSNAVYVVDTLKRNEGAPSTFEVKSELIGKVVESNQILRPWDNVPRKALAQEIIGNRIVYGNYLQNYTVKNSVNLTTSVSSYPHPYNQALQNTNGDISDLSPENIVLKTNPYGSLKTIRTYQPGVVFKDKYGRETPVFTNKTATVNLQVNKSDEINKLTIAPQGNPPSWATHYKFFVKEISNEYYNLALDRFYFAEDGNVWLSFPSSERNKVDEQTYLILKKQHVTDIAVDDLVRYKILAIENEAPEFISTFKRSVAYSNVGIGSGFSPDFSVITFTGPAEGQFSSAVNADNYIEISYSGNKTNKYRISSGGRTGSGDNYEISLAEPFGDDASFLASLSGGTSVSINIYKDSNENKEEFAGRFFVKINRNFEFDKNILDPFTEISDRYGIIAQLNFKYFEVSDLIGEGSRFGPNWRDNGERAKKAKYRTTTKYSCPGVDSMGTDLPNSIKENYSTPFQGSKWLGFNWSGTDSNVFLPQEYGFENMGVTSNSLTNCKISPGVYLRFKNNYTDEVTKAYKVDYIEGHHSYRGARAANVGETGNKKMSWIIRLEKPITEEFMPATACETWNADKYSIQIVEKIIDDDNKLLSTNNPAVFETEPKEAVDLNLYYEISDAFPISEYNNSKELDWFNCYTYGNGVESNRIRDDFNAPTIDKGAKVSSILDEPYAEERRKSSFIWSQIYNSTSGINQLNQFIQAEQITKDLNPIYGSIQKLHARDTDLITLCEDKCFRVLANKDALFNADGNTNITSNNNVLGQATPYAGEYGISKNPESFASYGFRVYFTDKNRGAVIRLSADGITIISEKGMDDFFEDNLPISSKLLGSYDADKGLYNLTLYDLTQHWRNELSSDKDYHLSNDCDAKPSVFPTQTTISFDETANGWTSRKSFIPEEAISLNNIYYSFKNGLIWEHNVSDTYNNFYNVQYDSSFNLLINDSFNSVKGFSTLNYNGTKSRRFEYLYNSKWYSIDEINALVVTPTDVREKQPGWYVNYIKTDLEGGEVKEFLKKEGKWFNYIKGKEIFEDCDTNKGGNGIGQPDGVTSDTQDYILTVDINVNCS